MLRNCAVDCIDQSRPCLLFVRCSQPIRFHVSICRKRLHFSLQTNLTEVKTQQRGELGLFSLSQVMSLTPVSKTWGLCQCAMCLCPSHQAAKLEGFVSAPCVYVRHTSQQNLRALSVRHVFMSVTPVSKTWGLCLCAMCLCPSHQSAKLEGFVSAPCVYGSTDG